DDAEASAEYARLMHDDLLQGHLDAIDVMATTAEASKLDDEQVAAWLAALNDIRLVLGTRLDVTEELYETGIPHGDPRTPQLAVTVAERIASIGVMPKRTMYGSCLAFQPWGYTPLSVP